MAPNYLIKRAALDCEKAGRPIPSCGSTRFFQNRLQYLSDNPPCQQFCGAANTAENRRPIPLLARSLSPVLEVRSGIDAGLNCKTQRSNLIGFESFGEIVRA